MEKKSAVVITPTREPNDLHNNARVYTFYSVECKMIYLFIIFFFFFNLKYIPLHIFGVFGCIVSKSCPFYYYLMKILIDVHTQPLT